MGDIDEDGLCDYDDYCDNTPLGAIINEEGCASGQYYDVGNDIEGFLKNKGFDIGVTDGKISEDIVDQVHEIRIDGSNLQEENVIGYFKNLRKLTLSNVSFENLDLTQMADLQELSISEYGDVSYMGSIDLSNLKSLSRLFINVSKADVGNGNKINSINLESCNKLSYMKIAGISLQGLDLSTLVNLKSLNCYGFHSLILILIRHQA